MEPGVTKAWSVRDIIAHVTTWEEEALKHLPAILEGPKPPHYSVTYGGIDSFNALTTTKKAGLSLVEVYRRQEEVHRKSSTRSCRRQRLSWRTKPVGVAACASIPYGHYPKHSEAIRRRRAQRQASGPGVPPCR
jgi:hypothetical protein